MKIKKLKLVGYQRFFLNKIKAIEYTPVSPIQIILGTNGSGKSSLLQTLQPLPFLKPDVLDRSDGYKEIILEHKDKEYILSYDAAKKHHSFKKEGKELNDTHQKSVQLELIKQEFNLDYKTMDILQGIETFTELSPANRKDWLISLSKINFDYSLAVYAKIKERETELKGTIQVLKEKINDLKTRAEDDRHFDLLNQRLQRLQELESEFQHARVYQHDTDISTKLERSHQALIDSGLPLLRLLAEHQGIHLDTLNQVNAQLRQEESLLSERQRVITEKGLEIQTAKQFISNPDIDTDMPIGQLRINVETISESLATLPLSDSYREAISLSMDTELKDIDTPYEHLLKIIQYFVYLTTQLKDIIPYLQSYGDLPVSHTDIQNLKKQIAVTKTKVQLREETLEDYRKEVSKLEEDKVKVECPACHNIFHYAKDKERLESLKRSIRDITKEIAELYETIKEDSKRLELLEEKHSRIESLDLNSPVLSDEFVLEYLLEYFQLDIYSELYVLSKERLLTLSFKVNTLYADSYKHQQYLSDIHPKLKKDLETYIVYRDDLKAKEQEYQELEKELITLKEQEAKLKQKIATVSKKRESYIQLTQKIREYEELALETKELKEAYRQELSNRAITEILQVLKTEKEQVISQIIELKAEKDTLKQQEEILKDLEARYAVLKKMNQGLNPNSGLIAATLYNFLKSLIGNMNKVIQNVWSYDMEIALPEIGEIVQLSYKFPVIVEGTMKIEDISKLSTGMKSIVNLAFIIAFRASLKIQDYPIYLDEFGNTFDATHRKNAFDLIERLKHSLGCQFFIVSHFDSMYGTFSHADINTLDRDMALDNNEIRLTYL